MSASWGELERAAPELARLGRERLERVGLALLGTVRKDGSPRISPVEAHLVGGELLFAAMTRSLKASDLARDPRCTLHSVVSDPDSGEGELKLHGRAAEVADPELRDAPRKAWWVSRPRGDAGVFAFSVEQAAFVEWDTARGEMTVRRWSPERGSSELRRPYP